jgi:mannose-6-phosphate isomerase-like protein (cupin superfamily)
MAERLPYVMNLDTRFGPLQLIDVPALAADVLEPWFNQTLCRVNDCVVRLGVVQGEFHWHKHDDEDEFFLVLAGEFSIDLEGDTVSLRPHQGYTVPRGVFHRPRAAERTVILMVEGHTVQPTGDPD